MLHINLKEKTMRVLLVALLLSVGACADKGYEALPNHDHIKCTGKSVSYTHLTLPTKVRV